MKITFSSGYNLVYNYYLDEQNKVSVYDLVIGNDYDLVNGVLVKYLGCEYGLYMFKPLNLNNIKPFVLDNDGFIKFSSLEFVYKHRTKSQNHNISAQY